MIESIITVLVIGFIAGFIFSMPVAGPISILITSNALKGNYRYCVRTAIGACVIEFFYVFLVVFGIAALYTYYKDFIPYILIVGSIFLFAVGLKIIKTKLDLENLDNKNINTDKIQNKGGLRAGLILNLTNPSLIIGWLTSSFLVFSFASSIGLNTGGLDLLVNENVNTLTEITGEQLKDLTENNSVLTEDIQTEESASAILLSTVYALAVAFGGFVWLFYFAKFIIKYRYKLKVSIINRIIQALGFCLCGISFYLIYKAGTIILQ